MRWIALVLASGLMLPASAASEIIYRCGASDGRIEYRQTPCATSSRKLGERRYEREPDSIPLAARAVIDTQVRGDSRRSISSKPGKSRSLRVSESVDACAEVRAQRDAWERTVGLRRTYDDLRRWNDAVARSCS